MSICLVAVLFLSSAFVLYSVPPASHSYLCPSLMHCLCSQSPGCMWVFPCTNKALMLRKFKARGLQGSWGLLTPFPCPFCAPRARWPRPVFPISLSTLSSPFPLTCCFCQVSARISLLHGFCTLNDSCHEGILPVPFLVTKTTTGLYSSHCSKCIAPHPSINARGQRPYNPRSCLVPRIM